jgi:hypothetical protein
MNILLEKHELFLILEALDAYELDMEHGAANGYKFAYTEKDVANIKNAISQYLED